MSPQGSGVHSVESTVPKGRDCWRHVVGLSPLDCCFGPTRSKLDLCFKKLGVFRYCCPWKSVEDAQVAMLRCDLAHNHVRWQMLQTEIDACVLNRLAQPNSFCVDAALAPLQHIQDTRCSLGMALAGAKGLLRCSLHKQRPEGPKLEFISTMRLYRMCSGYGIDQAACCLKSFCHQAVGLQSCSFVESVQCALCLLMIPAVLFRRSGWASSLGWLLFALQRETMTLHNLVPKTASEDLIAAVASAAPVEQHAALLQLGNHSGPLGARLVGTVLDNLLTHVVADSHPLEAWSILVETGCLAAFARWLQAPLKPQPPIIARKDVDELKNMFRSSPTLRTPSFQEIHVMRVQSELRLSSMARSSHAGFYEASWRVAIKTWPHRCCPPEVSGVRALLQKRSRVAAWAAILLAICLSCEANDRGLLRRIQRAMACMGPICSFLPSHQTGQTGIGLLQFDHSKWVWASAIELSLDRFVSWSRSRPVARHEVMSIADTFSFLKAGGSVARIGDGELLIINENATRPILRDVHVIENLRALALMGPGACPRFMLALVDMLGPSSQFPNRQDHTWWRGRAPSFLPVLKQYFPTGTFGNSYVTYPPEASLVCGWHKNWTDVFANKAVLVVGHPFAQLGTNGSPSAVHFQSDVPLGSSESVLLRKVMAISHRMVIHASTKHLGIFNKARQVLTLRKGVLPLRSVLQWFNLRDVILELAAHLLIDTIAVAWGSQGKPLIAELACNGIQAVDVGRLPYVVFLSAKVWRGTDQVERSIPREIKNSMHCTLWRNAV